MLCCNACSSLSLRYALGSLLCSQSHDVPLPFLQPEFPCVHADLAVGAGNSLASYEGSCSLCRFLLAKESYPCFLVGPPQRGAHENSRLMQRLSTCRKEPRGRGPGRPGQRLGCCWLQKLQEPLGVEEPEHLGLPRAEAEADQRPWLRLAAWAAWAAWAAAAVGGCGAKWSSAAWKLSLRGHRGPASTCNYRPATTFTF